MALLISMKAGDMVEVGYYVKYLLSWLFKIVLQYLEKNYSGRRIEWTACYRKHAPFTTTNHAEARQASLKRLVLDRKQNNLLNTLVYALLQHSHHRYIHLTSMMGSFSIPFYSTHSV